MPPRPAALIQRRKTVVNQELNDTTATGHGHGRPPTVEEFRWIADDDDIMSRCRRFSLVQLTSNVPSARRQAVIDRILMRQYSDERRRLRQFNRFDQGSDDNNGRISSSL